MTLTTNKVATKSHPYQLAIHIPTVANLTKARAISIKCAWTCYFPQTSDFNTKRDVICTLKYADDLVLGLREKPYYRA
jgi:hypothetical protein